MSAPVIVVGAGLAGLAAARRLKQANVPYLLLEASDRPGGRLKTDIIDGFHLDRGYQVHFEAYPQAKKDLDYKLLDFRAYPSGAIIHSKGRLHKIDPTDPVATLVPGFFKPEDLIKARSLALHAKGLTPQQVWREPDLPTYRYLRQKGFSPQFIERFVRPFFSGIFLDRSLDVSSQMFLFVWKMLAEGRAVVPSAGIEAIPHQLAQGLEIRYGAKVQRLVGTSRVTGVQLENGEELAASAVLLATEGNVAQELSGLPTVGPGRKQVCLYFSASMPPIDSPHIVLTADEGLVNLVVPVSNAVPEAAPPGKHLVAVTLLGDPVEDDATLALMAKAELESWFPGKEVDRWTLLKTYRIPYSQFAQPPGFRRTLPGAAPGRDGLYFAGEFTRYSSINGALEAGALAADLAIEDRARVGAHA